ncbi:MAG TPA: hypothetical protein PLL69_01915, partial [Gemmatimonadales bacterium]|nr:hypothetical protein [Gemmatimonadales bacterium]
MSEQGGEELGTDVSRVLREFINALTKSSMYPPGHKLAADTVAQFTEQLAVVLESRGTLTFGFTPRSLLVDGTVADQLGSAFRQFAQRMHRRNIGTIQFSPGVGPDEIVQMLASLGAGDAADEVGREGLRLAHIRVEPLVYEVLAFGEGTGADADLDEIFWSRLVEAAFGFRL